jgi:hypothetical protein
MLALFVGAMNCSRICAATQAKGTNAVQLQCIRCVALCDCDTASVLFYCVNARSSQAIMHEHLVINADDIIISYISCSSTSRHSSFFSWCCCTIVITMHTITTTTAAFISTTFGALATFICGNIHAVASCCCCCCRLCCFSSCSSRSSWFRRQFRRLFRASCYLKSFWYFFFVKYSVLQ